MGSSVEVLKAVEATGEVAAAAASRVLVRSSYRQAGNSTCRIGRGIQMHLRAARSMIHTQAQRRHPIYCTWCCRAASASSRGGACPSPDKASPPRWERWSARSGERASLDCGVLALFVPVCPFSLALGGRRRARYIRARGDHTSCCAAPNQPTNPITQRGVGRKKRTRVWGRHEKPNKCWTGPTPMPLRKP